MYSQLNGFHSSCWLSTTPRHYVNCRAKKARCELLSHDPGLKGVGHLLGHLPTWLSYTAREKMEWLNKLLVELWPVYDTGICKLVKVWRRMFVFRVEMH